jgi:hypothetical protein
LSNYPKFVESLVIGSGPSSAAAVLGLHHSGNSIVVMDVGHDLPNARKERIRSLSEKQARYWTESSFGPLDEISDSSGVGSKLSFGSAFAYAKTNQIKEGCVCHESHSKGGFSSVWGATFLPFAKAEQNVWYRDFFIQMQEAYIAILDEVPSIGSIDDELSDWYTSYKRTNAFPVSPPLSRLYKKNCLLSKSEDNFRLGLSRLAIDQACILCSQCLSGCIYGQIFNSYENLLAPLIESSDSISYFSGLTLLHFKEENGGVTCLFTNGDGEEVTVVAEQLFLGAGVIATSRIMLSSVNELKSITIRDSQTIFVPMVHPFKQCADSSGISLSNLVVAYSTEQGFLNQAQIYPYDDSFEYRLRNLFTNLPIPNFVFKILGLFLKRVLVAIVYLDQDQSNSIEITQDRQDSKFLLLRRIENANLKAHIKVSLRSLRSYLILRKFVLIPTLKQVLRAGEGVHLGASFPISDESTNSTSDLQGRPCNLTNVYLIDGSSLPRIPAGPVTLTIMANAYRIGRWANPKHGN